jgi:hypothetical protein
MKRTTQEQQTEYKPTEDDITSDSLHVVMYYSLKQCLSFLNTRTVHKQQVAVTGCSLEELGSFTGSQNTENGDDMTHSGLYWNDFIQCHILLKTRENEDRVFESATEDRLQTRTKPDYITLDQWNSSFCKSKRTANGQLKIGFKLLAYRIKYPMERIPINVELGAGSGVSHLCDITMCINPDHMDVLLTHQQNMDRQRCLGVTLVVYNDVIVAETPCIHTRNNDVKGTCCRRIHIVYINDWGAQVISKQYTDKISESQSNSATE